jgi:hypothetical protein
MSNLWTINVGGRIYGPYSAEQMHNFANEGRLAPQSLVARPGETNFRNAGDEPVLSALFNASQALAEVMETGTAAFGRHGEAEHDGKPSHVVILADMKSRSVTGLEEEIFNLGPAYAIMPQAWVVKTDLSVTVLRNMLMQKCGKLDVLFIVDATHDKSTWFNFGPEADTKLRRLWAKDPVRRAG